MYPRNVKNIPLHLDDTGDAHTYVGRINKAGESSNTFLLIQNVHLAFSFSFFFFSFLYLLFFLNDFK